jgi:hypothetical protein
MAAAIGALGLMGKLDEAGLLPKNCRRVVIDLEFDSAMRVYYEVIGDNRWHDVGIVSELVAGIRAANETANADAEAGGA